MMVAAGMSANIEPLARQGIERVDAHTIRVRTRQDLQDASGAFIQYDQEKFTVALGNCADRRAVDMLKRVIYARHDRTSRLSAIVTLREMGTAEAVDVLLEALVSDEGRLRQQAAKALIRMGAGILPQLRKLEKQTYGKPRRTLVHVLNSVAVVESEGKSGDFC